MRSVAEVQLIGLSTKKECCAVDMNRRGAHSGGVYLFISSGVACVGSLASPKSLNPSLANCESGEFNRTFEGLSAT